MSEVIKKTDNRATIRWKLLTGASAMALTAYVASTALAKAEDTDRPTLWIELGGQMELMDGLSGTPFTAPFMSAPQSPAVYQGSTLLRPLTEDVFQGDLPGTVQRPPRFAFGGDGKISFQPEDSDWIFSLGIRYGRSHSTRHIHHQTPGIEVQYYSFTPPPHLPIATFPLSSEAFLDSTVKSSEHHMVLDFKAGKDVGIGLLGPSGSSTLSAGVRMVDLSESMSGVIYARPSISVRYPGPKYAAPHGTFNAYTMMAQADRSFRGVGPSLSWDASAAVAGNKNDGELTVDWSLDGSLLFGRQKAKTSHSTQAHHRYISYHTFYGYQTGYTVQYGVLYGANGAHNHNNPLRSREVTVPNIGGSVGLSVKYPNFKFSIGYRYDTFLKAMDTGIDARETSNLTFQGPYASISIGLGD